MCIGSRFLVAAMVVATFTGCGGKLGGKALGGAALPSSPVAAPSGLAGASGEVDPDTCGNYAVSDAGRKLHDFLEATKLVAKTAQDTANVVKQSCLMMGKDLGMTDADFNGMETKPICAKVWGTIHDNMKVAFKAKAGIKIKYKPAVCKVDVDAEAKAAASCEGHANADVGASCSGECHGTCDGKCSGHAGTGGSGGQCNGQCSGSCHGSCEGHADVNASAQCKASAEVHASADVECTKPELTIKPVAKFIVDASKAKMTIQALQDGLPDLLSVKARLEPLQAAVETWAESAKELKDMGPKFVQSFKDQAMCISGQIAAAANMISNVQVNVNVSVSVSAEASGSVGG